MVYATECLRQHADDTWLVRVRPTHLSTPRSQRVEQIVRVATSEQQTTEAKGAQRSADGYGNPDDTTITDNHQSA